MSDWYSASPIVEAPAAAPSMLPAHRDLAIRTVYGEAGNEPDEGQAAVAAVIKNRMQTGKYGGDTIPGVVLAKNQFEPWNNNDARARMMALKPDDPRYQKIGGIVDGVFSGDTADPTNGSTHFVAPAAQAALGRPMPSWAQGDGLPIGRHTFFAPEGRVQTASAQGGNWWSSAPVVGQDAQQAPAQPSAPAPLASAVQGASGNVAPLGPMDRLEKAWENPAPGGLMSMVKPMASGINTMMQAGHGDIPMTGPDGHTNPAVIDASWEAAKGLTPMTAAPGGILAAPVGKGLPVRGAPPPEPVVPSIPELKAAATGAEGFQSAAIKELEIKPKAISDFAQETKAALNEAGLDDTVATGTHKILAKLTKAPNEEGATAIITGKNIQSVRKTLGNAAQERQIDGTLTPNAVAARKAQSALDDLIPTLGEKDVIAGNPAAASSVQKTANANYAAAKTAESVDRKVIQAQNRAGATNSGMNVSNTIRQRMASVMNNPAEFGRFKPDEQELIRQIVHGTPTANALRFVGNLLGGGGGLGTVAAATVGGLATGGPGAALPLVGIALKALGNRMTVRQAEKLSELVRSRAPLANALNDFGTKAQAFTTAQNPQSMAGITLAARNLSNNLKDAGITMSPADIFRSLQAPGVGRADQDQQNIPRPPAQ